MVNDTAEPSPYDLEDIEMYQYGSVEEEKNKEIRRQMLKPVAQPNFANPAGIA